MTLLVVGGAGIYFGTLYMLGMRVQHLRVQRDQDPGASRVIPPTSSRGCAHGTDPGPATTCVQRHRGSVVTVGNYDGVHRGHQAMLGVVHRRARELGLPATVVTFEPSPREFFSATRRRRG